ncbi:sensor domain-containing protein [Nocardioides ferulae]|uniref:sensor domain-containing protein n=1 Tax=Nocardioides ferulae TaxID=2340821 RepID=UPI000EB2CDB3|nr:sensor domain-containing protein [Nocardioides ferulae]
MSRRRHRAALVLAAAALVVPATAAPATAAAKPPAVPKVGAVAKIYPHLAGGSADEYTGQVPSIGKGCSEGKPVKGARYRSASYQAADATYPTGDTPGVGASAARFRSAKSASTWLRKAVARNKRCAGDAYSGDPDATVKVSTIRFKAGQQRAGLRVKVVADGTTTFSDTLMVRQGKRLVIASAYSLDGKAPAKAKSIKLAKRALKVAG